MKVAPDDARPSGPRGYLLLNVGGWLLFGVGMTVVAMDVQPWQLAIATTPAYILIGFVLSLLLSLLYNRLRVGPKSFGRAVGISLAGSYVAGVLWTLPFHAYRHFVSPFISGMLGRPTSLPEGRQWWVLDFGVINCLPLFALSLLRLGLQYSTALREQQEHSLRAETAARDAQLRMLAYQLNPHFLFNTLNSIRALINEDRQRARAMVIALSGYLRYALVERPMHVALLEEEVESVGGYLAIEKERFEERLDARMEIDRAALRCEVPAFLLNPLVENALKHGAPGTASEPLVVRVQARLKEPDRLVIIVENTGVWKGRSLRERAAGERDDGELGGLGLANVRARLKALYPGDHRVGMEHGCGRVRFMVELPARFRAEAST